MSARAARTPVGAVPCDGRLPRWLLALAWLAVAGYVALVAVELGHGYAAAARGDAPRYTDYTSLYAASLLAQRAPAEDLYRPREMYRANVDAAYAAYGAGLPAEHARKAGFAPWMYPPPFILFALPLAWLPYLPSFIAWIVATALPYAAAMRAIVPHRASALAFGFAAPPALFNLAYGQTGFLSGGFLGLGLAHVGTRPALAGLFLGLASVKPHLGVLVPVALAAGGHWRAFGWAAASVVGLAALSIALLGIDPWYGFIGTTLFNLDGFRAGAYTWSSMTSVLSTAHLAGMPLDAAWRLQYAAAALAALTVAAVWAHGRARPHTLGLQAAVLCLATPLAIPMIYLYDLAVVVPGAAWVWVDLARRGARVGEYALLAVGLGGLLAAFLVAAHLGVQIGAACIAALLGLALARYRGAAQGRAAAQAVAA